MYCVKLTLSEKRLQTVMAGKPSNLDNDDRMLLWVLQLRTEHLHIENTTDRLCHLFVLAKTAKCFSRLAKK